jgi:hypothetical protein
MNKNDCIIVVDELRNNISYPDVEISPLSGCGLPDFPIGKMIRKEAIVMHLRWQCKYLNGDIDEEQLSEELSILKSKKVIMV